jgi:hypothetical protein
VSGGEAMLAAQWRERYELTSKEKYDLLEKLKVYERTGTMGKSIEESYNELKDEHRVMNELTCHLPALSLNMLFNE